MICVILGHMTVPEEMRQFIFSFHMPLFFFLSGFLYRGEFSARWFFKKVDALLIPYVLYGAIEVLTRWIVKDEDVTGLLRCYLLGNGVGITWFLTCLFVCELMGAGVVSVFERIKIAWVKWMAVVCIGGVGWWLGGLDVFCFMKWNIAIAALAFWLTGYLAAPFRHLEIRRSYVWNAAPILLLIGVAASTFQRVDMVAGKYGNPVLFYGTALVVIAALIMACKELLTWHRVLGHIGRRALLFMCWHNILPPIVLSVLLEIGINPESDPAIKLLVRAGNLALLVAVVELCNRYSRLLSGKARILSCR